MKLIIFIFLLIISKFCLGQEKYQNEINSLVKAIVLDSLNYSNNGKIINVLFDPPYSNSDKYLIELEKEKYYNLLNYDSLFGIINPFKHDSINKLSYFKALNHFSFDSTEKQIIRFTKEDYERLFKRDSSKESINYQGHQIKKYAPNYNDSLLFMLDSISWTNIQIFFGDCYISYEIPIFNKIFTYALIEWAYACNYDKGQGMYSLYRKTNGKWLLFKSNIIWKNDIKN